MCGGGGGASKRDNSFDMVTSTNKTYFHYNKEVYIIIAYINYPLIHTHTGVVRSSEYCVMAVQRSVEIEKNKERTKIT